MLLLSNATPPAAEPGTTTIAQLTQALEQLRQQELRRFSKRLPADQADSLDELTAALVQRVVQSLAHQLGAARQRGNSLPLLQVLTTLFDLQAYPTD